MVLNQEYQRESHHSLQSLYSWKQMFQYGVATHIHLYQKKSSHLHEQTRWWPLHCELLKVLFKWISWSTAIQLMLITTVISDSNEQVLCPKVCFLNDNSHPHSVNLDVNTPTEMGWDVTILFILLICHLSVTFICLWHQRYTQEAKNSSQRMKWKMQLGSGVDMSRKTSPNWNTKTSRMLK